jgi:hypothetical protein
LRLESSCSSSDSRWGMYAIWSAEVPVLFHSIATSCRNCELCIYASSTAWQVSIIMCCSMQLKQLSCCQRGRSCVRASTQRCCTLPLQTTGASITHTANNWSSYCTSSNGNSNSSEGSSRLVLPEQQLRVVATFRSYVSEMQQA